MQVPLQITFEGGLAGSDSLRRRIEREAGKLERYSDRIGSCRVAVIGRGGKSRHGGLYAVRLQLSGPGLGEVVVTRNPPADHAHEDAFVAVRDVFAAARRRLQDRHDRLGGRLKAHEAHHSRMVTPFPEAEAEDDFDALGSPAYGGQTARIAYV
jgi:hypothetical protein